MNAARTALDRWQYSDGDEEFMTSQIPPHDEFKPSYYQMPDIFGEQASEDEIPTDTKASEPQETPPVEPTAAADPSMGADPAAMGGDPAAMGGDIGPPEGPSTPIEVGRLYELKKIHARLVSVQSFLSDSTDPQLGELRKYVNQSIELFRTLISNIQLFKDQLDDIIVMFYSFLDTIFTMLSKYYKTNGGGSARFVRTWGK